MTEIQKLIIAIILLIAPMTVHAGIKEATADGMNGFQIEGDKKVWLDLDNPNILGKSYNEIRDWAFANGFRFAVSSDLDKLVDAILPEGDFSSESFEDDNHFTLSEENIIGRTGPDGSIEVSTGYISAEVTRTTTSIFVLPVVSFCRCDPVISDQCSLPTSSAEESSLGQEDGPRWDGALEGYSAWLIYNGDPGTVDIGVEAITVKDKDGYDMDGFRIRNDNRQWLTLDNPYLRWKTYNEIKAWADENGFRLATRSDMEDLVWAVMPQGRLTGSLYSNSELHYTEDEKGIITTTASSRIDYSYGYLLQESENSIVIGGITSGTPTSSTMLVSEYLSGWSVYEDSDPDAADTYDVTTSAWLIYDGEQIEENGFEDIIIQGRKTPGEGISFTRELQGASVSGGGIELVANGSFEGSASDWTWDQAVIHFDAATAYDGNLSASFPEQGVFNLIYQKIIIPSNALTAVLSLKYRYSDDTADMEGYGGTCILDGETREILGCDYLDQDRDTRGDWYNLTADLSGRIGTRIYLVHFMNNAGGGKNEMVMDDVSITASLSDKVAVHQFYTAIGESHYFTADEENKYKIFDNWLDYWYYVGIGWYGYAEEQPGTIPVHHFYAQSTEKHYFTASEEEKDYIVATWPDYWEYVGVAWYGNQTREPGTIPIYQFYSYQGDSHYFTACEAEKDLIMALWPEYWTYLGIGWYGYESLE